MVNLVLQFQMFCESEPMIHVWCAHFHNQLGRETVVILTISAFFSSLTSLLFHSLSLLTSFYQPYSFPPSPCLLLSTNLTPSLPLPAYFFLPTLLLPSLPSKKVMRVCDKTLSEDKLKWVKFSSIAWTHDNKGFFYQVHSHMQLKNGGRTDGHALTDRLQ